VTAKAQPQNSPFVAHAEKTYRAALLHYKSEPNNVEAVSQFGRASFDRAELSANSSQRADLAQPAIDACERALSTHDDVAALHYYLAMNFGELAQTKGIGALRLVRRMETEFTRALELDPHLDYAGPDRNLGMLYLEAPGWPTSIGNHSKARQHLMRAVQIAPEYPENHLDLLEGYLKFGDDNGAQLEAQRIFAMLPQAREKFTGEQWASSWADWNTRWHEFESKLDQKPRARSPHQKK
jgi:tetratricopeptide (TPR) repeat protein